MRSAADRRESYSGESWAGRSGPRARSGWRRSRRRYLSGAAQVSTDALWKAHESRKHARHDLVAEEWEGAYERRPHLVDGIALARRGLLTGLAVAPAPVVGETEEVKPPADERDGERAEDTEDVNRQGGLEGEAGERVEGADACLARRLGGCDALL